MLVIKPNARDRFEKAKVIARILNLTKQFAQQLNFLRTYANHTLGYPQCKVELDYDFAPHSFSITWYRWSKEDKQWKYWFNGGLIFTSPATPADGSFPSLTVDLIPGRYGWFVYT